MSAAMENWLRSWFINTLWMALVSFAFVGGLGDAGLCEEAGFLPVDDSCWV